MECHFNPGSGNEGPGPHDDDGTDDDKDGDPGPDDSDPPEEDGGDDQPCPIGVKRTLSGWALAHLRQGRRKTHRP